VVRPLSGVVVSGDVGAWWMVVAAAAASVTFPGRRPATLAGGFGGILLVVNQVALAVTVLAVVVDAGSLVVRFRRARGVERQQLRWVALAAALVALAGMVVLAGLAVGAAILRYRLYDLDRIISRTLAYGLLTVLLGLGYAGIVLGLGQLVPKGSSLVVAGATLAVAGVFQPARRRIQRAVDRRFNRRRYDAAQTIQAFSARLRDEIDLDTLTAELLTVVEQTMQPTRVSLWLRPSISVPQDQSSTGASHATSPPTAATRSAPTAL